MKMFRGFGKFGGAAVFVAVVLCCRLVGAGEVYDVCVVGGGTAGVPAAICAGKVGAKVLLVEQGSQVGGTMTVGGVNWPGLFHAWGRQVIAGPGWDLCTNAVLMAGGALPDFLRACGWKHWEHQVRVPVPLYVALAEEALRAAGVEILYYTAPIGVKRIGDEWEMRLAALGKEKVIRARQIIDATGSASVAAMMGAKRVKEEERQPGSYAYHLDLGCDVNGLDFGALESAAEKAKAAGELKEGDYRISIEHYLRALGDVYNYVKGADGSSAEGRSAANLEGRAGMLRMVRFLRKQAGLEKVKVVSMAGECGVRETYRVVAETMVSEEDYVSGRVFEDAVAYAFYPVDLHSGKGVEPRQLAEGVVATIPLSAMRPKGVEDVYVVGRAIGSDRAANSGLRVQAACMAMGQAAGVAAGMAAKEGKVDLGKVRTTLRGLGAIVPGR